MRNMTKVIAAAIITTGLAGVPMVLAQSQPGQAPETGSPAMSPNEMQDMMQGEGGMMGMMNMMSQMNEMMGACTKMMQAMTPGEEAPDGGEEPGSPG
ncbi:MAG: hypothetical protein H0T75_14555 [Rhizobiales bacterium]|nr:hypothetical protein [Hyphomicrobiales bacterium]